MKYLISLTLIFLQAQLFAQKPELMVPVGHTSDVMAVAISPDGKYVATGGYDKVVLLWNSDGHLIRRLEGHTGGINSVKFSSDGKSILTSSDDKTAKLWDLFGKETASFEGHTDEVNDAAFSPSGDSIVTGSKDQTARIWETRTGQELKILRTHIPNKKDMGHHPMLEVTAVAFSPDGKHILTGNNAFASAVDYRTHKTFHSGGPFARLWSTTGDTLVAFHGHKQIVQSAVFSSTGDSILTTSKDSTVKIWDRKGNLLKSYHPKNMLVYTACFSPDGKKIAYGGWGTDVLDLATGKVLPLRPYSNPTSIFDVTFSKDGKKVLVGGNSKKAHLFGADGTLEETFKGASSFIKTAAFSPDGTRILAAGEHAYMWHLDDFNVEALTGHKKTILEAGFAKNGTSFYTLGGDSTVRIWDTHSSDGNQQRKNILTHRESAAHIHSVAISDDGAYFLIGLNDGSAKFYDKEGKKISEYKLTNYRPKVDGKKDEVSAVGFSPGTHYFALQDWVYNGLHLFDPVNKTKHFLQVTFDDNNQINDFSFSPDNKTIAVADRVGMVHIWGLDGEKVREFRVTEDTKRGTGFKPAGKPEDMFYPNHPTTVAFSPAKQLLITGDKKGRVRIFTPEGKLHKEFQAHTTEIREAIFSPRCPEGQECPLGNSGYILTAASDHSIKLWTKDGEEIANLVTLENDEWVVHAPSGLFDASPGAMKEMYFVQDFDIIELEQLKERYYEPGLLSKLLGFQEGEVRDVEVFDKQLALYPEVEVFIKNSVLNISLKERNGGIGKVSIFVNHKEVSEDANPSRKTSLAIGLTQFSKYFKPGENQVAIRVYNKEGWLKSEAIELVYKPTGSLEGSGPSLHVVAIGTSDYNGEKLDLSFAGKDAVAMATALNAAGNELFKGKVYTYLLATEKTETSQVPSKSNIKQTFESIAVNAKPQDIILVYLSGHGVTYGSSEKGNFYYLTKDIGSEDLSDSEIRKNYAISDEELTTWINDIPSLKQVMIIDACNSGKVVENLLSGKKNLNSTQVRALDRMKDRTGMFVLSGSAADMVSYEATQYGQGLLTYSILTGMNGRAIQDDGRVDVMKLFQFSRDEVPGLAKSIRGIQTPMLIFPTDGSSFDIGIVNEGVKIPVSEVKPIFVRNVFQDEMVYDDVLDLSEKLNQYLMGVTSKGGNSKLVYVNASRYTENAYSVKGRYTQSGDEVTVSAILFKGKTQVAPIIVTGNKSDLDALIKMIMAEVKGHL